jgi:hypothetical protein
LSFKNRIKINPTKKNNAIENAANLIPEAEGSVTSILAKMALKESYCR